MILFYINKKVSNLISNDNIQCFRNIRHLLNYTNIIISLRTIESPITEMFFDKGIPI